MDPAESSAIVWILMPLYADPNKMIRLLFIRFLRNVPSVVECRCSSLLPYPEDMTILPLTSWEDILTDIASITVNAKHLTDLMSSLDDLNSHPMSTELVILYPYLGYDYVMSFSHLMMIAFTSQLFQKN